MVCQTKPTVSEQPTYSPRVLDFFIYLNGKKMQKDENFRKVSSICIESISEESLTVPLLAFSKFKMAAGGHLEIQHKIQMSQNGYIL